MHKSKDKYYILKDRQGCDVIYINYKNMIYTNLKDTKLYYQNYLYYKYLNEGICSIYNITDNISIIKKESKKSINWYFKDLDEDKIYTNNINNNQRCAIYFNDFYIIFTTLNYGGGIDEFIFGYDILNKKQLDMENSIVQDQMYKYLIEIRGCTKYNLLSILNNDIRNHEMMYRFMSFVLEIDINDKNYNEYINEVKEYILKVYPEFYENNNSMFYFHRKDKVINNLTYKKQKTYKK